MKKIIFTAFAILLLSQTIIADGSGSSTFFFSNIVTNIIAQD